MMKQRLLLSIQLLPSYALIEPHAGQAPCAELATSKTRGNTQAEAMAKPLFYTGVVHSKTKENITFSLVFLLCMVDLSPALL